MDDRDTKVDDELWRDCEEQRDAIERAAA